MRVLILLALLGTALAVPKSMNRIVGGEVTTVDRYPYMCNMQHNVWNIWWTQFCGGSLLTTTFILSAAHCYKGDSPVQWRVRLGTNFATSGGTLHILSQIILHERYDDLYNDDVALVRLADPAVYSNTVQPARIAGVNYIVPDGTPVYAVGWGALYSGGGYPEELRHVGVYIINQEICAARYAYLKTLPGFELWSDVTDGMLCSGILDIGGRDACQGDSGGPLAHEAADGDVIVGVTSWGYGCGHEFYPGVNVRVSYFSDWIVQNAQ